MAFNRFASWINKSKKKSDKTEYDGISKIMKEQLELGILEEVTSLGTIEEVRRELGDNPHVYDKVAVKPGSKFTHVLPWHATTKKSTGKRRVFYDAAAKAKTETRRNRGGEGNTPEARARRDALTERSRDARNRSRGFSGRGTSDPGGQAARGV